MEKESLHGRITQSTKVNFTRTAFKGREFTHGMMGEYIMAIGRIIKWMEGVYLHGRMGGNM